LNNQWQRLSKTGREDTKKKKGTVLRIIKLNEFTVLVRFRSGSG